MTRDHVPPQNLFPEPRPSHLITVPCCENCRQTQSIDDEYFKNMIVMRQDVAPNPHASRVLESVQRALARPQRLGFAVSLLASIEQVEIRSLAGLYLGRGTTYTVGTGRLDRVMQRTLLGLYFHETDVRLPDTHRAVVYSLAGLPDATLDQQALLQRLVRVAVSGRVRVLGQGVFAYAFQGIQDAPHVSVWVFLVYTRVAFIGFTAPCEDFP